jgi:acyl dehydratase
LACKARFGFDELAVGRSASVSKTITETDVYLFAGISGDFDPRHVNEQFAKTTPPGMRVAHGALQGAYALRRHHHVQGRAGGGHGFGAGDASSEGVGRRPPRR